MGDVALKSVIDTPSVKKEFDTVSAYFQELVDKILAMNESGQKLNMAQTFRDLTQASTQAQTAMNNAGTAQAKYEAQVENTVDAVRAAIAAIPSLTDLYKAQIGTIDENTKTQIRYKNELAQIKEAQKELTAAFAGSTQSVDALNAKQVQLAVREAQTKAAIAETNLTIRSQAKELLAVEGSYDQLNQRMLQMQRVFKSLNDDEKNNEFGKKLVADINTLKNVLKGDDAGMGDFQRNVGNYAGSFAKPFRVVNEELLKVRQNMSGMSSGDDGFAGLAQKEKQLEAITQSLTKEFGSAKQELAAFSEAAQRMGKQFGENSEVYKSFVESVRSSDVALRTFGTNVGTYANSFGGALKVLETQLEQVRLKLSGMNEGDAGFASLSNQEQLLSRLTSGLNQEFSSTRQELRMFTEAARQMAQVIGQDSVTYREFIAAVGETDKVLQQVNRTIKTQASDTKNIQGLVQIAHELMGVYQIGFGVTQLFGDDNEKFNESMRKMFAVMSIMNGLQSVSNGLRRGGAAAVLAQTIAERASNAVAIIKNYILTGQVGLTKAATVAQVENTEAEVANAAAAEENAVAQEELAVAEQEVTVATEKSSVALITWRGALIATGIGAVLLLISAAASAMTTFGNSTKQAAKDAEDLAQAQNKLDEIFIDQADLLNKTDQTSKKLYEAQLARSQASGEDATKQFAIKKELAKAEQDIADHQVEHLKVTADGQGKLLSQIQNADDKAKKALDAYQDEVKTLADLKASAASSSIFEDPAAKGERSRNTSIAEDLVKQFKDASDAATTTTQGLKDMWNAGDAALKAQSDASIKNQTIQLEEAKFNADEQRQIALQSAKIKAEAVQQSNAVILSNDRSTYAQRIAAMKSNLQQEIAIIEAEKHAKLSDPSVTPAGRYMAEREAAASAAKARSQSTEELRQAAEAEQKRNFAAEYATQKAKIEMEANTQKEIFSDTENGFHDRLAAFDAYTQKEKMLLEGEYNYQLKSQIMNQKEQEALAADHQEKMAQFTYSSGTQRSSVVKSSLETTEKTQSVFIDIEGINEDAAGLEKLNAALKAGTISLKEYDLAKKKLEDSSASKALEAQIVALEKIREGYYANANEYEDFGAQIEAIDKQIAANRKALAEDESNYDRAVKEKKLEQQRQLQDATVNLARETNDLIFSLLDDQVERQKNAIQKQVNNIDKYAAADVERVQQSIGDEKQKAAQIANINAEAAAQKTLLAQREKKLDQEKAKYDKEKALADAAINTALGVIKAFATAPWPVNIVMAALVAATGAVEIAKIASTPIPTYAKGTPNHPGGPAVVGDAGVEGVITPSGKAFLTPGRPTLMNLEKGTRVIPNNMLRADEMNRIMWNQMVASTANILQMREVDETSRKLDRVTDALESQTETLVRTINQANRPIRITNRIDNTRADYLDKKVYK